MSAPSDSATTSSPCACTNISLMQLFHELKQKFPGVPDHVVSNTIELYCHNKQACEKHLHSEVKASLTHAYHASSQAAARQLNESKLLTPLKCRNQPIVKHEISTSTELQSITCQSPQTAVLSLNNVTDENDKNQINTDANQNLVKSDNDNLEKRNNNSPVTVINIDNCYAKYTAESPSDLELTNDNNEDRDNKCITSITSTEEQSGSTNYRILKSNKVRSNLNEKLEKGKEKKTIKKEDPPVNEPPQGKPKRPNTLDFIKLNPDVAFRQPLKEPETNTNSISPAQQKCENQSVKDTPQSFVHSGYPLNLSVNVNCHMDLSRGYDPWFQDYDSPRAITSVNLTVCTPSSSMASPVRDEEGGFEGQVTVTVSPSSSRPSRRAPPPPAAPPARALHPDQRPKPVRPPPPVPESSEPSNERSLIERQKERLSRLARALGQEQGQLKQLTKETQILSAPPPSAAAAQRLREYVERLRDECDSLAKRLEMCGPETEDPGNFYSNIYTGQRAPQSWQCHMCTFRNHPLLDKCEECDMPRIYVGTSPSRTHDSGFGSFRDRNRRATAEAVNATSIDSIVDDCRALPELC